MYSLIAGENIFALWQYTLLTNYILKINYAPSVLTGAGILRFNSLPLGPLNVFFPPLAPTLEHRADL
jgi:hypothetical protein